MLDIFASFAGLIFDVIDTDRHAQNGSTHCCVFADFQTLIFNKQHKKLNKVSARARACVCVCFLLLFLYFY